MWHSHLLSERPRSTCRLPGSSEEEERFLCGNEEGFPMEMLELGFKEVQALSSGHGTLGREKSMSKGMRLAGLVG